jgi:sulfite exporter TauE/SafE
VVALSRKDRRALREIEEVLAAEDPGLAVLLGKLGRRRSDRVLRRITRVAVTVAVLMVVLGLLLAHPGLLVSGLLLLVALPRTLWLISIRLFGRED